MSDKSKQTKKVYGKKETYVCANPDCENEFEARVADRKRGNAKYCSRSCAAKANPPHYRGSGGGVKSHKGYDPKTNTVKKEAEGSDS